MLKIKKQSSVKKRLENRKFVIEQLGHKCVCCGESNIEFLCVDHIDGGGNKHRKEIRMSIYLYLKKYGIDKSKYRILCANCNMAYAYSGYCPHKGVINE